MRVVVLDFETKSPVDLPKCGRTKYAAHPETTILMMSYKVDDEPTKLWLPGNPLPDFVKEPHNFVLKAHNAQFEEAIWNNDGIRQGFAPVKISNFVDIMALCGRYGLPQSLDEACKVLDTPVKKDPAGYGLIKTFCIPPYGRDSKGNILPHLMPNWRKFGQYCIDDTKAEYWLLKYLPSDKLSDAEQEAWVLSCEVNARGIPVDKSEIEIIYRVSSEYRDAQFERLPDLTNGKITKITQVKRLKDFFNEHGCDIDDCTSETIQDLLTRDNLPDVVMDLAEMRATIGLSSVGKYARLMDMEHNGRVFDNQRYYGTHTGRWSGGGFQLFNLPRAKVPDPEAEIKSFFDFSICEANPITSARALIRPMIKAPPGRQIMVADYSSIEYVVLEWFAGDYESLERFNQGIDQYVDQAAFMYNKSNHEITDQERQEGKIVILGCGYQLGANGFIRNAAQWGLHLTHEQAQFMVQGYRKKHAKVAKMWYSFKDAAIAAIYNKGKAFSTNHCVFKVVVDKVKTEWLMIQLPTGRAMYYRSPFIDPDGTYGEAPCHYGRHPKSGRFVPMTLTPGRITENIVQAAARDILVTGKLALRAAGYDIIGSIYDEVIAEVPDLSYLGPEANAENLQKFYALMCTKAPWAKDIPLRANGFVGPRYKKI